MTIFSVTSSLPSWILLKITDTWSTMQIASAPNWSRDKWDSAKQWLIGQRPAIWSKAAQSCPPVRRVSPRVQILCVTLFTLWGISLKFSLKNDQPYAHMDHGLEIVHHVLSLSTSTRVETKSLSLSPFIYARSIYLDSKIKRCTHIISFSW